MSRSRGGLADGFGLPVLLQLDEQKVVAQLRFGEGGRIALELFVDQANLPVISMAGTIGIVMEREELRKARHGLVRMGVIHGIGVLASRGANGSRGSGGGVRWCARLGAVEVGVAGE